MLTPRENFLETIKKGGKPDRLCCCYDSLRAIRGDPLYHLMRDNRIRGKESVDIWGAHIIFPENQISAMPHITEENQVIQDIEHWQKYVKVPDIRALCGDWTEALESKNSIDHSQYLDMEIIATGIFEQLHMLMTFENTLCNLLLYPDEMHELIDVITEYKMVYFHMITENLHPDVILSHDDFGTKNSLFMSRETWCEFFKEPYRRLYTYLHENGVIVMHHADCFCEPIAEDMAEIGVDVWQGVIPANHIEEISKKLDGRMALMGGIDSVIDREDVGEEEIRREVRRACAAYGGLHNFIPSYTYGAPGTLFPHVDEIIHDELAKYNTEAY